MYSVYDPDSMMSLWNIPDIVTQKLPGETFTATAKISFHPKHPGERFGLVLFGTDYASINIIKKGDQLYTIAFENINAAKSRQMGRRKNWNVLPAE